MNNGNMNTIQWITKQLSNYHPVGSNALRKNKNFLLDYMTLLGMHTKEQFFTRRIHSHDVHFSNLIGINPHAEPPYTVLCAHLDSPTIDSCPSATDASTSIAIILELYWKIIQEHPDKAFMVLFVDGEEAIDGEWTEDNTLSGSSYFATHIDPFLIEKVYVFDLIGGDPRHCIHAFRDQPHTWKDMHQLASLNKRYKPILFVSPEEEMGGYSPMDDHVPFQRNHMYSMNIIPSVFPVFHHTRYDDYNHVNWVVVCTFFQVWYDFFTIK